jgi:hypothetical protein
MYSTAYEASLEVARQRGFIYTENKPLGRLCKICNPFFHEFWVHSERILACQLYWARIFKRVWGPGIDTKE